MYAFLYWAHYESLIARRVTWSRGGGTARAEVKVVDLRESPLAEIYPGNLGHSILSKLEC